jgi:hypothetical protein
MKFPLDNVITTNRVLPQPLGSPIQNLKKPRAYAEAESYINTSGNGFIYIFCGRISGGPGVLSSYEKFPVDDALALNTLTDIWVETPLTTLSPRFAFDIAKVIF